MIKNSKIILKPSNINGYMKFKTSKTVKAVDIASFRYLINILLDF